MKYISANFKKQEICQNKEYFCVFGVRSAFMVKVSGGLSYLHRINAADLLKQNHSFGLANLACRELIEINA